MYLRVSSNQHYVISSTLSGDTRGQKDALNLGTQTEALTVP